MTVTLAKLKKFCDIRHKSGFASNFQFQIDCEEAGLTIKELGPVEKGSMNLGGFGGEIPVYRWKNKAGVLVELAGRINAYAHDKAPALERVVWEE